MATTTTTKRIEYEDDLVIVYDERGHEIYRGLEDYDPNKDLDWRYDEATGKYKCLLKSASGTVVWTKICIA